MKVGGAAYTQVRLIHEFLRYLAVLLSVKIVVKSGGPRCAVVAIGGLCCIKKRVTITFAFMTSLDVEVAAGNNCAIGLFLSTSVTAA